jgi:hypothetical protein
MGGLTLNIETGNAAMLTPADVAGALRDVADKIEHSGYHDEGRVRDENGNTVGSWDLSIDEIEEEEV